MVRTATTKPSRAKTPGAAGDATTIAHANLLNTTAQGALPTNFIVRFYDSPGITGYDNSAEISHRGRSCSRSPGQAHTGRRGQGYHGDEPW